jgi:hypothetical protein
VTPITAPRCAMGTNTQARTSNALGICIARSGGYQ